MGRMGEGKVERERVGEKKKGAEGGYAKILWVWFLRGQECVWRLARSCFLVSMIDKPTVRHSRDA